MQSDLTGSESAAAPTAPQSGAVATAVGVEETEADVIFAMAGRSDRGLLVGLASREDVNDFLDSEVTDGEWETLISALRDHRLIMAQIGAGMLADHREASTTKERRRRPRLVFGRREQPAFVGDSPSDTPAS